MAITLLPTPPTRGDPENFAQRGDAFLSALPTFAVEANTLQADVNAKQITASEAAVTAAAKADSATSSESNASDSSIAASSSAGDALVSKNAAEAALDSFDDRYLGAKSTAPTLDNDGAAIISGALYWDTVLNGGSLRVRQAGAWVTIPANVASAIITTPAGGLSATNVQAALAELDSEKANSASPSLNSPTVDSLNGGQLAGLRNLIINGRFRHNQRAVAATVTLAAGVYGHDRFKAGASGCTYTSSTTNGLMILNITAGSLVQVIEGDNVTESSYVMAWTGTAQGRKLAGTYGASPEIITATPGANLSVEFGIGTLTKVQVEIGSVATPFEQRPIGLELMLCQRYFHPLRGGIGTVGNVNTLFRVQVRNPVTMRSSPTISMVGSLVVQPGNGGGVLLAGIGAVYNSAFFTEFDAPLASSTTAALGSAAIIQTDSTGYIAVSAEL